MKLPANMVSCSNQRISVQTHNKRMLSDWFSAALQTSRKCGRYVAMQICETAMEEWDEIVKFVDKRNREIEITIDEYGPKIEARYNNVLIGSFEFDDYGSSIILAHASIDAAFQKCGIGTKMLQEFSELSDDWFVPNGNWCKSTGHEYYLSLEGAALLNSCLKQGIITDKHEAPY